MSDIVGSKPTIRELEILQAMIRTGRTVTAAQTLGLSQPAVSRALAMLEGKIGRRLFSRDGNRLIPTAEALSIDSAASSILDALEHLGRPGGPVATGLPLRIAVSPTIAQFYLPVMMAGFCARYEDVRLEVEIARGTDVLSLVADRRADLGIVDAPPAHPAITAITLRECQAHVIMPQDHRLAGVSRLSPAQLAREPMVALVRRFASRTDFDQAFHRARVIQTIVAEVSTIAFAVELVRVGVGIALLNPFPLSLGGLDGLVAVPFDPQVHYRTSVLMPAAGTRNLIARQFVDHLLAHPVACPLSLSPI
ncbi:MAG: LysR family transcriptional regulator [Rhodospirillales bacterium]